MPVKSWQVVDSSIWQGWRVHHFAATVAWDQQSEVLIGPKKRLSFCTEVLTTSHNRVPEMIVVCNGLRLTGARGKDPQDVWCRGWGLLGRQSTFFGAGRGFSSKLQGSQHVFFAWKFYFTKGSHEVLIHFDNMKLMVSQHETHESYESCFIVSKLPGRHLWHVSVTVGITPVTFCSEHGSCCIGKSLENRPSRAWQYLKKKVDLRSETSDIIVRWMLKEC